MSSIFFFSSRRRHTRCLSDWSSDVCSSDLNRRQVEELSVLHELARAMAGQLDREALLETLRVHVPPLLSARKLVVVLADEQRGDLEVVLRVVDGGVDDHATRYGRSVGLTSVVMETGRPFRTDDYA